MWLATTTGSIPDSGRAPCAPLPVIAISKKAPPAIIGPGRIWNLPTASPGRLCMPKISLAREFVEQPVLDHRLGAAQALFGGLEDEMHGAVEIAALREIARRAEQHRRVSVMAAGMHPALVLRAMREGVGFEDRQAIHVGPQPDRARRVADPQPADDAGLADAAMHLDAEPLELFGDQIGGALFLEAELGMGVDVAPPFGQLVVKAADLVDDRHVLLLGWHTLG